LRGQTSYFGNFTVGGVRKIRTGKLQHHSSALTSKYVLIIVRISGMTLYNGNSRVPYNAYNDILPFLKNVSPKNLIAVLH
jgi:hypothetical protein